MRNSREGRRLGAALAISLVAHVVVLAALHMPRNEQQEAPVAVVLTTTFRQPPPAPSAPVPPTAPPAPPSDAQTRVTAEPSQASAGPSRAEPAPSAPAPAVAPAPAPGSPPRADDQIFLTQEQWSTPPVPQATPDPNALAGVRIVGRRLLLKVWIDDEGVVRRAEVVPYELDPKIAALLERMVDRVRFAPASLEGRAIGASVTSHLCFDDQGHLDTSSEDCWNFGAPR